jgi:hypothetical protein
MSEAPTYSKAIAACQAILGEDVFKALWRAQVGLPRILEMAALEAFLSGYHIGEMFDHSNFVRFAVRTLRMGGYLVDDT